MCSVCLHLRRSQVYIRPSVHELRFDTPSQSLVNWIHHSIWMYLCRYIRNRVVLQCHKVVSFNRNFGV